MIKLIVLRLHNTVGHHDKQCRVIQLDEDHVWLQYENGEDAILTVNPHIEVGYSIQLCVKGKWCGRPVQTLHELENLYLDLTGKELSVD